MSDLTDDNAGVTPSDLDERGTITVKRDCHGG
jgi:hypothetical protein